MYWIRALAFSMMGQSWVGMTLLALTAAHRIFCLQSKNLFPLFPFARTGAVK